MLRTGLDIRTGLRNLVREKNYNKNIEMKEKIIEEGPGRQMVSFIMEDQNILHCQEIKKIVNLIINC